jgi:GTP-binding protein
MDHGEGRDPLKDYRAIRKELKKYSEALAARPEIVVLSKADIPEVREAYPALKKRFGRAKIPLHLISAVTGDGMPALIVALWEIVKANKTAGKS